MGGSIGKSKNSGGNSWSNNVWKPQGDALQNLYDQAGNFLGESMGNDWSSQINDLYDSISGASSNQAAGGAFGDADEIRNQLMSMMGQPSQTGQMYESIVGGKGNTYVDPLVDQMREDASKNLSTLQSSNALDAAAMGQSGSSRHAMENAMLGKEVNSQLSSDINAARANAYDTDLGMKLGIAQKADSNLQAEQDRLYNMLNGINNSQSNAIDQSSNMLNLLMGSQSAGWNPLYNFANIIGSPIMTGSGSGSSKGKGFGTGGGLW